MKRFEEIALIAASCFVLSSLVSLAVLSVSAGAFGGGATGQQAVDAFAADVAKFGFALFAYSICVGVSFLIFDIGRLSAFARRALHLVLNYAMMAAFFLLVSAGKERRTLMLFVLTFVYVVVYFAGMLICRALKKALAALDKAIAQRRRKRS